MDRFGVDTAIISNLNGIFYKNSQAANEELFEEIKSDKKFGERFIPFAVINPIYAGWKEDLDICIHHFGMRGVRLYPLYHDYGITDPPAIDLIKSARDYGIPICFALRMVDSRQRSWMDIAVEWELKDVIPIIREVPDAKYMILNVANGMKLSEDDATILKNTQVLIDTSGREITDLAGLLKIYGPEKFAFGSHAPILDIATGLLRIESLRVTEADPQTKEMIRSGNARTFLGM
jgi:predicted TIM-barrel fold metal-dependent hydrolase